MAERTTTPGRYDACAEHAAGRDCQVHGPVCSPSRKDRAIERATRERGYPPTAGQALSAYEIELRQELGSMVERAWRTCIPGEGGQLVKDYVDPGIVRVILEAALFGGG